MSGLDRCMTGFDTGLWGVCRWADLEPAISCRAAARLPERGRSVIVLLFPYLVGEFPRRNVARYAVVDDYHRVAGAILQELAETLGRVYPGEAFVPFVDNSPVREVEAARLAGLGTVGLHRQLIHPRYGSYAFIGTVVTTLELPVRPAKDTRCLECGACVRACPSGALAKDSFDRSRCRSHITQKKGVLTPWEHAQVRDGGLAWGCDLCQEACPMNRDAGLTPVEAFFQEPAPVLTRGKLDRLMAEKPYGWRSREVLLRNLTILNNDQE